MKYPLPTQSRLKEVLDYDPLTGVFTRRTTRGGQMKGSVVGVAHDGYLVARVDAYVYRLHRLAFIWMTGSCPEFVDHKDRNRSNNVWSNLRKASRSLNSVNVDRIHRRAGGLPNNIYRRKNAGGTSFVVTFKRNHKATYVGIFKSLHEAVLARNAYLATLEY